MNTDKEMAALYLARSEGKIIQHNMDGMFCDVEAGDDLRRGVEYRIKPEPEVIYVNQTNTGNIFHYTSEKIAKMDTNPSNFCFIAKKFIEVVE